MEDISTGGKVFLALTAIAVIVLYLEAMGVIPIP